MTIAVETMSNALNNSTTDTNTVVSWIATTFLQVINLWSIVSNAIVIGLIKRTPALRGFTGNLMINQAVAELLLNTTTFILTFLAFSGHAFQLEIALRLFAYAFNGVAVFSLSVMSINIYLAICKPRGLKKRSQKQRWVIIGASWVINIGIMSLYYIQADLFSISDTTQQVILDVKQSNFWLPLIVIVDIAVLPFCINVASYSLITYKTKMKMTLILGLNNQDKMRLSKLIHVIAIAYLLTYIPLATVIALKVEVLGLKATCAVLNHLYHASKILLYMKLYVPFRTTAKKTFCRSRTNVVEAIRIQAISTQQKTCEETENAV